MSELKSKHETESKNRRNCRTGNVVGENKIACGAG
jgi:hypothetical protein